MALLHIVQDTFSTLELFQNDESARAPEPYPVPAANVQAQLETAPEIDSAPSAPETLPEQGLEVLYNKSPPEAVNVNGDIKQPETSTTLRKTIFLKRKNFAFAALAVLLLMALAVGLGVGLRKSPRAYPSSSATARPSGGPISMNTASPTASAHPVNSSFTQQILNDTSFAAIYMNSGDRHVFFQDIKGDIQQVVYAASEDQWIVKTNPTGISDARYLTPLAADVVEQDVSTSLHLYYISVSNRLSSRTYTDGIWWQSSEDLSNYTTFPSTRQLSVTSTNSTGTVAANETVNQSLLLYENLHGDVSALLRVARAATDPCDAIALTCLKLGLGTKSHWIDITSNNKSEARFGFSPIYFIGRFNQTFSSTLYETNGGTTLRAPFASAPTPFLDQSILDVQMLFYDYNSTSFLTSEYTSWNNASYGKFYSGWETSTTSNQVNFENSDFIESDLVMISPPGYLFAVWVNGTRPAVINFNPPTNTAPVGPFPFRRLASITLANQTESYLYHQINGTTLAEGQYLPSLNQWITTSYITISSS